MSFLIFLRSTDIQQNCIVVVGTVGPAPSGQDYEEGWKYAREAGLPIVDEHSYIPAVLLGGGASVVSRHLSPKDGLCKTIFLLDDKVNAVGFERALTAVSRRKSEA